SLSKRAWCSGARSSRLTIGFTRAIVALLLAAPAAAPAPPDTSIAAGQGLAALTGPAFPPAPGALTRCSSGSPPAGWERSPSVSELSLVNSGLHRIAHLVGRRHG